MTKRAALFVLFTLIAALPAAARAQADSPAAAQAPRPAEMTGTTASPAPGATVAPGATAPAAGSIALPPATPAPKTPAVEPFSALGFISVAGAAQFLFQWRQEDTGTDAPKVERFLTRRLQLSLYGRPAEKTRYGIVLDFVDGDLIDPAANGFTGRVREAWIGFDPLPWLAFDVGSFRPPWTLTMDDQVSDETFIRYPLLVAVNPFTPWSQTGGMITVHGGNYLALSAGLWNGLDSPGNLVDTDQNKDAMVSVKVEFYPGLRLYLGDWRGDTEVSSGSTTVGAEHNSIWLGTEIEKSGFSLGAEALWNQLTPDTGAKVNAFGYQVSMGYTYRAIQPVLRYEQFDPDKGTANNEQEWTTLGLNLMLNHSTRLMADYIFKSERLANDVANDEFLIQVSTWF